MSQSPAASNAQIEALVDFMSQHKKFACGKLRSSEGRLRAKQLWETLSKSLNSIEGCTKSVEQWQRVWADKKYLVKKAVSAVRRSASAADGDPLDAPTLSQMDLSILSIMGDSYAETSASFAMVPAFSTSPPPEREELRADSPILSCTSANSQPHIQTPIFTEEVELPTTHKPLPISRRVRTRVRRSVNSVTRSRLIELEEQRNEVLGEIRDAIVDLSNLLREHISRNN